MEEEVAADAPSMLAVLCRERRKRARSESYKVKTKWENQMKEPNRKRAKEEGAKRHAERKM